MKRKILLIMATLMATGAVYSAESVDINIGAKLVAPLTMTKSADNLIGQVLTGTQGDFNLTPINVSFRGASDAFIKFTTDQYVDITNGTDTIRLTTGLQGGSIVSNGTTVESELVLSSAGTGELEMKGSVTLSGNESVGDYVGSADISVDYN